MRGILTGQRYVDDILRPHVGPFLNGLPEAIFQQDNARSHTARVAQDFLRYFQTLPWPARSPDLSPVEHGIRWEYMMSRNAVTESLTLLMLYLSWVMELKRQRLLARQEQLGRVVRSEWLHQDVEEQE
ncbi:transposable element Tc1 transposase [Trichonephila clavipes]|nr:transposable element Tc1 transposase [Trichonephila clavipes]